jgi:predicted GNAT family acetyltransferase
MADIQLSLNDKQHGSFFIQEGEEKIAEMVIAIAGSNLTVYHTEVVPEEEGKGLAHELLVYMVEYARQHQLKVIPLCPYVHAQFKRHPELYQDLWEGDKS